MFPSCSLGAHGTTGLATLRQRVRDIGVQQIIDCTEDRQVLDIATVFSAARTAGYADGAELRHLTFGTVRGDDRKPLKTRDGSAASLSDLINPTLASLSEKVADIQAATVEGLGASMFAMFYQCVSTGV